MINVDQPTQRSTTKDGSGLLENGLRPDEWTRHTGMLKLMTDYIVKKSPELRPTYEDVLEDVKVVLWEAQETYEPSFNTTFANWAWRLLYQRHDRILRLHTGHGYVMKTHQSEVPLNDEAYRHQSEDLTPLDELELRECREAVETLPSCLPDFMGDGRVILALASELRPRGGGTGVSLAGSIIRGSSSGWTGVLPRVRKHFETLEYVCSKALDHVKAELGASMTPAMERN